MESFQPLGKSLPSKEAGLVKQVVKLLESKKYPKALKKIDKVLSKSPNDEEALSLKANILSCMGNKDEALAFAKQGVMKNFKSAFSWHILSQIYYVDKNFPEAYKAEQKASVFAPTNNSIMRNLSLLQLHNRDYPSFRDSRKQILVTNFTGMINWISYAVAEYFCGDFEKTITILDSFLRSMEKHMSNQELSETLLFKARVLKELGKFEEMAGFLTENREKVRDSPMWLEWATKATIGAKQFEPALKYVKELIEVNSEHPGYFHWYFEAKEYQTDEEKLQGLQELIELYPKSTAAKREELSLLHENILEKLGIYVSARVRKGIPSIFSDIKALLQEEIRGRVILDYVKTNVESLRTSKAFTDTSTSQPCGQVEQPQCLMWMLYLYSQLLDYFKMFDEALVAIDEAIDHTPTVPDLYLFKAKVLKHQKNLAKAAEIAQEARLLDLGDRYLNNKASKYLLRNNQIAETEEVMAVFSKEKANELNVHDMQSMWYELELGEAYYRTENFQKAAEEFKWIEKHMLEMFEDQYDFHFYCYRKMNLNSYVDFMNFEDSLTKHNNLLRAGLGLLRIHFKDDKLVSLLEASRILKLLIKYHPHHIELNTYGYTVFTQRQMHLLALRSLDKLRNEESFAKYRQDFVQAIEAKPFNDTVQEIVLRVLNR